MELAGHLYNRYTLPLNIVTWSEVARNIYCYISIEYDFPYLSKQSDVSV